MNHRLRLRSVKSRLAPLFVAALLAFAPIQLIAAPPATDLLNQALRPTIEELKNHDLSNLPANNLTTVSNALKEHAAEFIAALDRLYPNAIYSTMGRDSVLHADMLEAFYLSIGQSERVQRFNVSGASFTAGAPMVEYLEQLGLNLDPKDKSPRPFVLIDTATSTTGARQPRNALNMAYQVFQQRGGEAKDFVGRAFIVGLAANGGAGYAKDLKGAETILDLHKNKFAGGAVPANFFVGNGDFVFVTHDKGRDYTNDFSGVGYVTAEMWSAGTFGTPKIDQNGKVIAQPGGAASAAERQSILALQKELLEQFSTPQFLDEVKTEAQKMGHIFTGKVVAPKNPILAPYTGSPYAVPPKTFLETFEEIDKLIKKAKNSPETKFLDLVKDLDSAEKGEGGKTAANFEKLKAALLSQNGKVDAAVAAYAMVNAIYEARKQDKISTYEIRKLLIEILASTDPSVSMAKRLLELSEKSNSFRRAFTAADNFKASNATTTYDTLIKILKNSKGCNLTVLGI